MFGSYIVPNKECRFLFFSWPLFTLLLYLTIDLVARRNGYPGEKTNTRRFNEWVSTEPLHLEVRMVVLSSHVNKAEFILEYSRTSVCYSPTMIHQI